MLTATPSFIVSACLESRLKYIVCDFLLIFWFGLYFNDLFVPLGQNCDFILWENHWEFIFLRNHNLKWNFCCNRHICTLGGTINFLLFSIFFTDISSICPNSEQPNFSHDISPFWQLNSERGSFQLAEPTKTISFYWLSSTKRGFCICNLIIIRISISVSTSIFKLRIVLLDKRLISKLKRKRWALGLMGSKIKSLP